VSCATFQKQRLRSISAALLIAAIAWRCSGEDAAPAKPKVDFGKLKDQAQAMADGLRKGDYEKLADHTYPKLIELMGGRETMLAEVKKTMAAMKQEGFEILSYVVDTPTEVLGTPPDLAAILPQKMRIRLKNGVISQAAFLLAVSGDSGATWTFVDGAQLTPEIVKQILPKSLHGIKLPEVPPPAPE